jgi:hypothetical protein
VSGPERFWRVIGIPKEVDRRIRIRNFIDDAQAHQAIRLRRIAKGDFTHGRMLKCKVEGVTLRIERAFFPAAHLLTLRMPSLVEIEPLVIDDRLLHLARQVGRILSRTPLTFARCERRGWNAKGHALIASCAGRPEIHRPEPAPTAFEHEAELLRRHVDQHTDLERSLLGGEVDARMRWLNDVLKNPCQERSERDITALVRSQQAPRPPLFLVRDLVRDPSQKVSQWEETAILATVTREQVWKAVAESLRPDFGRLLDVRDVRRVRRVVGDAWVVTIVLAAPGGDMHVADVTVDDAGTMTPVLNADHVIDAARRAEKFTLGAQAASEASGIPDELADFGDAAPAEEDELSMLEELDAPLDTRIDQALAKGDPDSLRTARELLPRLLADHDRQGATLFKMAEVEVKLGENALARNYLEAAAREFADRFDLPNLEAAAALGLELVGKDAFAGSAVHTLLEQSRARLRPLDSVFLARSFTELPDYVRDRIIKNLSLRTLAPGEALVNEGEPSKNVFVVKSGLLGVWLEKPSGGSYLVRCCFPGWLLGESSVLGGSENPRCTATLRAERITEIWTIPGPVIRAAMEEDLPFGIKIAQTKQMHRIDSFFSMHETMGQLDVQVRDEMLSCIHRLETFDAHTTILKANEVPNVACLVARGSLAIYEDGKPNTPIGVIEPDSFYGVRDAIHRIAPSVSAVASPGTTVAFFDAIRLQQLCERSPEQVAAVLERLG